MTSFTNSQLPIVHLFQATSYSRLSSESSLDFTGDVASFRHLLIL
jgi:hypothetical protein